MARRSAKAQGELAEQLIEAQRKKALEDEGGEAEVVTDDIVPTDQDEDIIPDDDGGNAETTDLEGLEGLELEDEEETPPDSKPDSDYKHKYDVLNGKYNAETKRMADMLTSIMGENANLLRRIEELESGGNAPAHADTPENDGELNLLKSEYPSIYDGVMKLLKNEVKKTIQPANERLEQMEKASKQRADADYREQLTKAVPKWEAINNHPTFWKWIDGIDRYSGMTRRALLANAFARLDAKTTIAFFEDFIAEKGIKNAGATKETDIAPGSGGNSGPKPKSGVREITRSDIKEFYNDRANHRFKGTEEEAANFERRIIQAIKEKKVK